MKSFEAEASKLISNASTLNQNANHDGSEISNNITKLYSFSQEIISQSNKLFNYLTNNFSVLNKELSHAIEILEENTNKMI